jgi:5-methylcytosine-specific restriction endonuclease McrA
MNKFTCPQWYRYGGSFNESMYQIDHIKELCNGGTNKPENLHALCPHCHAAKTNYMNRNSTGIKRNV